MKWCLNMIIEECERLSALKNDTFSIPVALNGRLTATLGRVKHTVNTSTQECTPTLMEFSKKLIEHGTDEDIKKVIAHEWAHYYLGKTTKQQHGHDAVFNALSVEMGGNPGTSTIIEGYKDVKYKYETICSCCGKKTGGYTRACKTTKFPELYHSNCCNSPIRVIQNW